MKRSFLALSAFLLLSSCGTSAKAVKQGAPSLEGIRWVLVELEGQPVAREDMGNKEAYFLLKEGKVMGCGGCNNFGGSYELRKGMRISFSQMFSTMMACPRMDVEGRLLAVLKKADNYTVADGILSLNRARMASLARFKAAE